MTAPTPAVNVGQLVTDVKDGLNAVTSALTAIDKFAAFLPAQYKTPLEDLLKILTTVDGFLAKV